MPLHGQFGEGVHSLYSTFFPVWGRYYNTVSKKIFIFTDGLSPNVYKYLERSPVKNCVDIIRFSNYALLKNHSHDTAQPPACSQVTSGLQCYIFTSEKLFCILNREEAKILDTRDFFPHEITLQ